MRRRTVWISIAVVLFAAVVGVGAEQAELDPLLKLLVEQGVITMEQALAVQAEYDRRRMAEQAPTPPPQTAAVETAAVPPEEEATEEKDEKWGQYCNT